MADLEAAANTIRSRYQTEVETGLSLTTGYDNAPFTPPENSIHAYLNILWGDNIQVESPGTFRRVGIAQVTLREPIEQGDQASLSLADSIEPLFRRLTVNGVVFRTPSTGPGSRDGKWWQRIISCPFYTDESVTS